MVGIGGWGKLCQPGHHHLWGQQGPHISPHSIAKTNDRSTFLRKNGRISDVVITSVHSEKTRLKKLMKIMMLMMIINITEKPFTNKSKKEV